MIKYGFEGTNFKIFIINPPPVAKINLSLSFRKFRAFNKSNVIENNEYKEKTQLYLIRMGQLSVIYL